MSFHCLDPFCTEHPKRFQRPFRRSFSELQVKVHETAIEKGWWDDERDFGMMLALVHSEVSEALEAWRDPTTASEDWATELADCVIRIMDICTGSHVDLQAVIEKKMAINEKRPYRHGDKRA